MTENAIKFTVVSKKLGIENVYTLDPSAYSKIKNLHYEIELNPQTEDSGGILKVRVDGKSWQVLL